MAAALATAPVRALDLGSGAGVPGLVLALHWPDSTWVLLDANRRRVAFLERAAHRLGLTSRVSAVLGRAETTGRDAEHRSTYDLVTARSFGAPAVTAECGSPFLRVGGILAVSEPPADTDRWPPEHLALLGLVPLDRSPDPPPHVQLLRQGMLCPDLYPRRVGLPAKRPLF
jgi:16S rRNA (guanine527-N7)-methyltransferase